MFKLELQKPVWLNLVSPATKSTSQVVLPLTLYINQIQRNLQIFGKCDPYPPLANLLVHYHNIFARRRPYSSCKSLPNYSHSSKFLNCTNQVQMEEAWLWYGPDDPVSLDHVRQARTSHQHPWSFATTQAGAKAISTALFHLPAGQVRTPGIPSNFLESPENTWDYSHLFLLEMSTGQVLGLAGGGDFVETRRGESIGVGMDCGREHSRPRGGQTRPTVRQGEALESDWKKPCSNPPCNNTQSQFLGYTRMIWQSISGV